MGAARGVCIDLMRAIVSTGLLQFLGPQEQDPAAFVTKFLADPVYMLKVGLGSRTQGREVAVLHAGCGQEGGV